ncbi:MAG: Uma2 family endonuclease [Prochlorothrix sp.]|nr:Uma2 family endonuclease [Prochlorothrix sp.]
MNIPTLAPPKTYSLDDYRRLEERAEERHEYHNGEIIAMTGGSANHAWIIGNLFFLLRLAFQNTPFKAYGGDLRVWIPAYNRGLYPDISVFQEELLFNANRQDEVLNPCLLVEVLSASTEGYDRGDKFRFYRSLASLQDYLLVNQGEPVIEHYHREEADRWILTTYTGLEASLSLPLGHLEVPLAQIYQGINLKE